MDDLNTGRTSDTQAPHRAGALKKIFPNSLAVAATALSLIASTAKADPVKNSIDTEILFPTKKVISGAEVPGQPLNSSHNYIRDLQPLDTVTEGKTRFTVTTPSAGTLTISWIGSVGTGTGFQYDSPGYVGSNYDVNQIIQWGPDSGPMTTIATLGDDEVRINGGTAMIDHEFEKEGFRYLNVPQSVTIPIDAAGTFHLDNIVQVTNDAGGGKMQDVQFSFTPSSIAMPTPMLMPPEDDTDKDGFTNMQEYVFGTNPTEPNPNPIQYSFKTKQGEEYLTMIVPRNPDATDIDLSGEVSTDLIHWSPLVAKVVDATHLEFQAILSASHAPSQFFRVGISQK